ncbi:Lcl C-terminal domain-containing protein [Leptospira sp. GIMC2001]|uniref:Lcl C-terminal domain-containing protein n=1 Tax=Leptospira sp. GIMC2001 TaxID=1513297 RepID=UPI00234B7AB9|nr:DUF1566 domain-containing protein [Leptospira sp. GIMC2001]WCL50975.1 DUF1566 domain-containing protein [Leptospira sp. GIMC2001]
MKYLYFMNARVFSYILIYIIIAIFSNNCRVEMNSPADPTSKSYQETEILRFLLSTQASTQAESDDSSEETANDDEVKPGANILGRLQTGQTTTFQAGDNGDQISFSLARSFADNGDNTIEDLVTGLIWQRCSLGQTNDAGCTGPGDVYSWNDAVSQCAAVGSDWRLPTIQELATLIDMGATPRINGTYFPNTQNEYHSSTENQINTTESFNQRFSDGWVQSIAKSTEYSVRCVRGPTHVTNHSYVDNGDDTITDTVTNLTWMRCAFGQTNGGICTGGPIPNAWATAIGTCSGLALAGKTWRLPNRNEIFSILDFTRNVAPAIDVNYFSSAAPSNNSWSSTTTGTGAFVGRFAGDGSTGSAKGNGETVRCVTSD